MFRLPTHLESLVPPPTEQVPQSQPWRGTFVLPASSPHPSARPREIWVTAAETENDNSQQETWPKSFQLQVIRRNGILRDVHAWLAQLEPGRLSRCMIMPDRLQDANASRQNQATFETFARHLLDEGIVAIAPWSVTDPSPRGGLLIYPTTTTRALLVGIVFLEMNFPDFIFGLGSNSSPSAGPSRMHPGHLLSRLQPFPSGVQHTYLDPPPPGISSTARYGQAGLDAARRRGG
ncbi:hypothetical protein BV20DRAFT_1024116 [Pilatotrama ljubarskyi]|nr:hypothetical protein BV20DRAFT_1024116 [Pilatotrama ljubarskyi]